MMSEDERQEYEANVFAVCLLMPKDRLMTELKKENFDLSGDDKRFMEICKLFKVSAAALAFRLSLLKPIK